MNVLGCLSRLTGRLCGVVTIGILVGLVASCSTTTYSTLRDSTPMSSQQLAAFFEMQMNSGAEWRPAPPLKFERFVAPGYLSGKSTATAVVRIRVHPDSGMIVGTDVIETTDERFAAAVVLAVKQWRVTPFLINGKRSHAVYDLPFQFLRK